MSTPLRLRPWQHAALDRFAARDARRLPGRRHARAPARRRSPSPRPVQHLARRTPAPAPVVVVAPTPHLKLQWARAAARLGLHLDPTWSAARRAPAGRHARHRDHLPAGGHRQTPAHAARPWPSDAFVVLDEIHHAGDDQAWGDGSAPPSSRPPGGWPCRAPRSGATPRPSRSCATTTRTRPRADYEYGYGEALRDGGVVRPVYFPRIDGQWSGSRPTASSSTRDVRRRARPARRRPAPAHRPVARRRVAAGGARPGPRAADGDPRRASPTPAAW